MKRFFLRLAKLILGLFLYALGIVITINAGIGYAPWDVFHVGTAKTTGLTLGTVSIITGFVLVVITIALGEKFGIGTIMNMVLIGIFIDRIIAFKMIPSAHSFWPGLLMIIVGTIVVAIASYFYISSGFGTGPRDGLMIALSRKIGLPVGVCRGMIELLATGSGYFLGGQVGSGTVIYVILVSVFVQIAFKLFRFDPKTLEHEDIRDTIASFSKG